jgi:hypothetical protein
MIIRNKYDIGLRPYGMRRDGQADGKTSTGKYMDKCASKNEP